MFVASDEKLGSVQDHRECLPNESGMTTPRSDSDNLSLRDDARGDNLPEGYFGSLQFIGTVLGFALTAISAFMFLLMPYSILSVINADIGPSDFISWVSIARTLALAFSYTIVGRLGDLYGRRWFYIGGNIVSLLAIIICAVAPNVGTLIAGCTIYGLGEVVQLTFSVALGELVPNKYRPAIASFIFLTNAPFASFGPVIARKFVSTGLGWRWVFYINIIACGLGTVLLFFFYFPPKFDQLHTRHTKKQLLKELDYLGMFLFVAGLTLLLVGVSLGGGVYPWQSAPPLATMLTGFCCLVALGIYEVKADLKYPLLPSQFFKNRAFLSLVVNMAIATCFYNPFTIIWPQLVSNIYTHDPSRIGWISCTIGAGCAFGQAFGFAVIQWGGNVRYWMIFCTALMVALGCSLASLNQHNLDMGIAFTTIGSFALGIVELVALTIAPLFCKADDIGLATGLLLSMRSVGGSVSVAVFTTILRNRLQHTIPQVVGTAAVEAGLPADQVAILSRGVATGTWTKLPGLPAEVVEAVTETIPIAWLQASKTVYLAAIGFGVIGIIASLLTKDARRHLTGKVERKMNLKHLHEATVEKQDPDPVEEKA